MAGSGPYPHWPGWTIPAPPVAEAQPDAAPSEVDDATLFAALVRCQRLPCIQDQVAELKRRFVIGQRPKA